MGGPRAELSLHTLSGVHNVVFQLLKMWLGHSLSNSPSSPPLPLAWNPAGFSHVYTGTAPKAREQEPLLHDVAASCAPRKPTLRCSFECGLLLKECLRGQHCGTESKEAGLGGSKGQRCRPLLLWATCGQACPSGLIHISHSPPHVSYLGELYRHPLSCTSQRPGHLPSCLFSPTSNKLCKFSHVNFSCISLFLVLFVAIGVQ